MNYYNPYNNPSFPNPSSQSQRSPSDDFIPSPPVQCSSEDFPAVALSHIGEIQDFLRHFVKSHGESHRILVKRTLKNQKGINVLAENQIKSHKNIMDALQDLNPADNMRIDTESHLPPSTAHSEHKEFQNLLASISSLGAQIGSIQTSISNIEKHLNSASISQKNTTNLSERKILII